MLKKNKLIRSLSTVLSISVLAKITAFASELIITFYLGTSYKADAFNMISGIHQVTYPMLSVGIWTVFLPEYKKQMVKNGIEYADRMANKMLSIFLLAAVLLSILMLLYSDIIVQLVAPGFHNEVKQLTIQLVQISAPQYIFIIIAAFYASMLQSHNNFFASQIREVISYVPLILGAIFLYRVYGVYVLAIGILAGSILRLLVQVPYLNWGYQYRFRMDLKDKNVRHMLKKMPSALINAGVIQLNTLVDKILASGLQVGAVSSLSYGQRLSNVFSGLVSETVSTTLYPTIAEMVVKGDMNHLKSILIKTIYLISMITIPISVMSISFSKDIVSLVFERGEFGSQSVYFTAVVFAGYSIGILFNGLKGIFDKVFYSFGDTKTAMKIGLLIIGLNIVLNIILVQFWGVAGLAVASSISVGVGMVYGYIKLGHYVNIRTKDIVIELTKITMASSISILLTFTVVQLVTLSLFIKLGVTGILTLILYVLALKLFHSRSLEIVIVFIRREAG